MSEGEMGEEKRDGERPRLACTKSSVRIVSTAGLCSGSLERRTATSDPRDSEHSSGSGAGGCMRT